MEAQEIIGHDAIVCERAPWVRCFALPRNGDKLFWCIRVRVVQVACVYAHISSFRSVIASGARSMFPIGYYF